MTEREYAVAYGDSLVYDGSWRSIADVIASYHGSDYCLPDHRVSGALLSRPRGSREWGELHSQHAEE